MTGRDGIQSLLTLRKLTRAIADAMRQQMSEHLATLTPLLRPAVVFGEYVQGGQHEPTRKAGTAFKELQSLYNTVATAPPFNLPRDLRHPLNLGSSSLEITPLDYAHVATAGSDTRTITVRSPFTWILTYTGFPPSRLREALGTKLRSADDIQKIVLSYLVMDVVTRQQPGILQMLDALHFPITTSRSPEFGELPITRIGVGIATTRPADAVIIESAAVTGMDAFEEVVHVDDIEGLRDPLKDRLMAIAREHVPDRVPR